MRTLTVGARRIFWSGLLLLVTAIIAGPAQAQNQELTFSLGGIPGQSAPFRTQAAPRKSQRIEALELTTASLPERGDSGSLWGN